MQWVFIFLIWGIPCMILAGSETLPLTAKMCFLMTVMVTITRFDRESRRIPRRLTIFLWAAALLFHIPPEAEASPACLLIGACTGLLLPMTGLWLLRGRGLGGGDLQVMAAGGFLLGVEGILLAVGLACLMALPEAVETSRGGARLFPFGPYLCLGIWIVVLSAAI